MTGPSRLVFDPSTVSGHGNVFLLSTTGGLSFGGTDLGGSASAVSMEDVGGVRGAKRRPFFSSPEELILEDEYYDEQLLPEKKRRLTPEQVHLLERSFEAENKLEPERKIELAKKLGLQPRQVAVWFQNRRARWKNKQIEHDFDRLKSLYDALLADHDSLRSNHESLVADNQRLRSEVMSLTERLQAKDSSGEGQQPPDEVLVKYDANPQVAPLPDVRPRAEDQLSTGSAVVDVETVEEPLLVVDSGETYNHTEAVVEDGSYHAAFGYVVQSEEDDGSDDNGGYFTGVLASDYAVIEQPLEVELDAMGSDWWVWS